jgi:hypothetical protein
VVVVATPQIIKVMEALVVVPVEPVLQTTEYLLKMLMEA